MSRMCLSGGIFFPLAKALCLACGSDPEKGTQKKMGAYLMKTCFQVWCTRQFFAPFTQWRALLCADPQQWPLMECTSIAAVLFVPGA